MANRIEPLIHHLRKVLRPTIDSRLTDGELLGQFVAMRDEAAFEALVRRHGKMVLCVCRRLLGNAHDAEDAFQATFLVLTRKAVSVSPREAVGSWLYGVAYRTAREARVRNSRRKSREQQVADMAQVAEREEEWQKLVPLLDQELVRLPDKYRLPVVLCELEGRSRKEVARQLGVPEGTLSSRVATARKMLAKRMAKYGPPSGAVLATVLSQAAEASLPPALVSSTLKAALGGSSATVVALAQGVLKAMLVSKLKTASCIILIASMSAGAIGLTSAQQGAPASVGSVALAQAVRINPKDELRKATRELEAAESRLKLAQARVERARAEFEAARDRNFVTRVYAVGTPLDSDVDQVIKQITCKIDPASWETKGGEASIEYFPLTKSLVVKQRQENHERIGMVISTLRRSAVVAKARQDLEAILANLSREEDDKTVHQAIAELNRLLKERKATYK